MPGEWYSPNQIVQAIDKILADNKIPCNRLDLI